MNENNNNETMHNEIGDLMRLGLIPCYEYKVLATEGNEPTLEERVSAANLLGAEGWAWAGSYVDKKTGIFYSLFGRVRGYKAL